MPLNISTYEKREGIEISGSFDDFRKERIVSQAKLMKKVCTVVYVFCTVATVVFLVAALAMMTAAFVIPLILGVIAGVFLVGVVVGAVLDAKFKAQLKDLEEEKQKQIGDIFSCDLTFVQVWEEFSKNRVDRFVNFGMDIEEARALDAVYRMIERLPVASAFFAMKYPISNGPWNTIIQRELWGIRIASLQNQNYTLEQELKDFFEESNKENSEAYNPSKLDYKDTKVKLYAYYGQHENYNYVFDQEYKRYSEASSI